jgi:uncharacterized membrane protein YbhN (UPF0104 family)
VTPEGVTRGPPTPPALRGRASPVQRVLAGAVVLLAAWFIVANGQELRGVMGVLRHATPGWLAAGVVVCGMWLVNQAAFHAAAQRAVGLSASVRRLLVPSCAAVFLNIVVKSGGMAGLGALRSEGRTLAKPLGAVTAAYLLVAVTGEVGFAAVLAGAIAVMVADGILTAAEVLGVVVFLLYLGARLGLLLAAVRSREAARRVASAPTRLWARVRRLPPPRVDTRAADEVVDAVGVLRASPGQAVPVLAHALAVEGLGVILVWVSMEAVGIHARPALALVSYAVSVLFTIVGILPAGLATVELSMTAVLVSSGVVASTAAAAVILYRLFELWLPLGVGSLSARRLHVRGHP